LSADALSGCPASFAAATVTVNAALPLLLLDFSGGNISNQLVFEWSTSNEINVSHFELEESIDGNRFAWIANIDLQQNTAVVHTYHFTINKQLTGATYYRLKIVDNDGKEAFSKIIIIRPAGRPYPAAQAGPNPFSTLLRVSYHAEKNTTIKLVLSDVYGRIVKTYTNKMQQGDNILSLKDLENLTTGIYFLLLGNADGSNKMIFKLEKSK